MLSDIRAASWWSNSAAGAPLGDRQAREIVRRLLHVHGPRRELHGAEGRVGPLRAWLANCHVTVS